ncbi:MAG: TolC family protein [Candidatus Accumulibacter sp.]|uniref:TolC family protein n=1 Tax=Accumulibacter sp. TaxID=2053492 RepID=UPI001B0C36AF|nr:TolC family protein [Accumulibacter sp.]MBO3702745.1 TolC family protein [Accumulibacter sp.]
MTNTTSRPGSLLARAARFLTAIVIVLAALPGQLSAGEVSDPFATDAITPPPPALDLSAAQNAYLPCQALPDDTPYGVLEVVDLALCKNPTTREVWAIARLQAAQVGVAKSDFLPALDGRLAVNRLRGEARSATQRSASLTLSWLLIDFGARSANLEVARQLLSAAAATLDATVQSVFLGALQSYFNAQAARAAVSAALESEKASRESLTAAEVRYRVGTGTPADRLQAQTAWSQATLNRIRSEGVLRNMLGRLAKVMGLDANHRLRLDDIPTTTPDSGFDRDIAALIAEARQRRPEMKAAEAELKAAQSGIDYARASGRPTISLSAGPQWENLDGLSGQGNAIGLSVQLPIFSGFNTTYQIRAAEARSEVQAARLENTRQEVALEVWENYQSLNTATQTIRTSADLLSSAEQSERVALGRYKAGVGNILDVLNAQSALAAARLQRIQAMLDWQVSRAALARSIGVLDSSLLLAVGGEPKARNP